MHGWSLLQRPLFPFSEKNDIRAYNLMLGMFIVLPIPKLSQDYKSFI